MMEILNVVICYYNAREIETYVEALKELPQSNSVRIMVVVNGATREDWSIIKQIEIKNLGLVQVYKPEENLGYMNGLIAGYKEYRRVQEEIPRYIIMSNTDIVYEQATFFQKLLQNQYSKDVWCIGPAICNVKGGYDNPVCEKRRTKKEIDKLIFRFKLGGGYVFLSELKSRFYKRKMEESRYVYEVHGCFFVLTSEFAEYLKDEWYGTLLYSEETFIAEHVWKNKKKVYYDNSLVVKHMEHSVTGRIKYKKISNYLRESMECIKDTFYE